MTAVGFLLKVPTRLVAAVMAFGSGVLISALSFELMDEAFRRGGIYSTGGGFLAGAAVYTALNRNGQMRYSSGKTAEVPVRGRQRARYRLARHRRSSVGRPRARSI